MKIVFVIGTSTGGVGTHVRALARDVAAAGHEIGVIGPASTDEHFGFSSLPGVRFAALDMGTGIGPGDAALVTKLRRIIRSFGAEIVHAHGFRAGLVGLLASRTLRPRPCFIISLHNQASGQGLRGRVESGIETLLAKGADLTLGASTDLVVRAHDLGARDARFLPAAAPEVRTVSAEAAQATRAQLAKEYGFDRSAVIVLAVGRVAPQKNYPMLVRALAHLGEDVSTGAKTDTSATTTGAPAATPVSDLVVLVAGAADENVLADVRAQYESAQHENAAQNENAAQHENQGAASAVPELHFLGPRDDVAELNAAADIYVLTSVWEARALVLQEALIAGRAIIATSTGGTTELVGDAGILIESDDARGLADAISELVSDPARRVELGERARARGAQLPGEREVAEELMGIYTELLPPQVG